MNEVYIRRSDLNEWIVRHLSENKDLYSIGDLIGAIEDMDGEIERLKEKCDDIKQSYIQLQHRKLDFKEYGE